MSGLEEEEELNSPDLQRLLWESALQTDSWECTSCTFLNSRDTNTCQVCYKSRGVGGATEPAEGVICHQCTLVNSWGNTVCDVCGAKLLARPTAAPEIKRQDMDTVLGVLERSIREKESLLECSVCYEVVSQPPIYCCHQQHVVCPVCLPRLREGSI